MKIEISVHEKLETLVSKDWIINNACDSTTHNIGGYDVVITRDDNYNISCSYIDEYGEPADGMFIVLDEIDY